MNQLKVFIFILFLFSSNNHVFAQSCVVDHSTKFASNTQTDLLKILKDARNECRYKLFKDQSPKDSQHVCACENYTGSMPDRDIFDAKFSTQIHEVKEQYAEQTGRDPSKEKKLIDDLYHNYLKAKDNLPCGNATNIYPNKTNFTTLSNGGFYCAKDLKNTELLKLPLCLNGEKNKKNQEEIIKNIDDLYQKKYSDVEKALSKQFVCNPKPIDRANKALLSQDQPPCTLNFLKKFQDNSTAYQAGVTDQSLIKEIQDSECFRRTSKEGLEIDHIDIETSSSLLANTNEAMDKTFQQLSDERAEKIENSIFKKIPGLEKINYNLKTSGKNNDGTSGPCPYIYTETPPYWTRRKAITDEILDENKFARAKIYYKNKVEPVSGIGNQMVIQCSLVAFGCSSGSSFPADSFK